MKYEDLYSDIDYEDITVIKRVRSQELVSIENIDKWLKELGVNSMIEFYNNYSILPGGYSYVKKIDKNNSFIINYFDMFHMESSIKGFYLRGCDYTEYEYYKVLKTFYDSGEYDTFEYMAKLLEFTLTEETKELFDQYIILNSLNEDNKEDNESLW